jgi:Flp pilus assembly protein TadG
VRRLTRRRRQPGRPDRGAVLAWAAVMLAVLLGVGALVIDAGALYQERRQLQNGADAAALAVAKDCAEGDCRNESATATHFADENATDEASAVDTVCGEGPELTLGTCAEPPGVGGASGWVTVDTSTDNPANTGDDTQVEFLLAPVLDAANVGRTVTASASAAWGPVEATETVPLAMSTCALTDGGGPPPAGELPDGHAVLYFHGGHDEQTGANDCFWEGLPWTGQDGGFGWLDGADDCELVIRAGTARVGGPDTSNPDSVGCDPDAWLGEVVVLPVYDRAHDPPSGPFHYHISGFVGFRVTAYRFGTVTGGRPDCTWVFIQRSCIEGEFTTIATVGSGFGDGPDYGVRVVQMIG